MTSPKIIYSPDGSEISVLNHSVTDASAQIIFAHGAGANMSHEFMGIISSLLNDAGINVLRFNFPFMDKRALTGKKYPPDRMPKLVLCYEAVIDYMVVQQKGANLPLFIGGKSMGSRVAATLVSETDALRPDVLERISGVFCLGYPFHPSKKPEKLRLEPLFNANKPILIVQGDRDTLGTKDEILSYQLPKHCHSVFLDDGDHSLKPRVKSGFTYQAHIKLAVEEIVTFIEKLSAKNKAKHEENR